MARGINKIGSFIFTALLLMQIIVPSICAGETFLPSTAKKSFRGVKEIAIMFIAKEDINKEFANEISRKVFAQLENAGIPVVNVKGDIPYVTPSICIDISKVRVAERSCLVEFYVVKISLKQTVKTRYGITTYTDTWNSDNLGWAGPLAVRELVFALVEKGVNDFIITYLSESTK